jgi:hypothetical protein
MTWKRSGGLMRMSTGTAAPAAPWGPPAIQPRPRAAGGRSRRRRPLELEQASRRAWARAPALGSVGLTLGLAPRGRPRPPSSSPRASASASAGLGSAVGSASDSKSGSGFGDRLDAGSAASLPLARLSSGVGSSIAVLSCRAGATSAVAGASRLGRRLRAVGTLSASARLAPCAKRVPTTPFVFTLALDDDLHLVHATPRAAERRRRGPDAGLSAGAAAEGAEAWPSLSPGGHRRGLGRRLRADRGRTATGATAGRTVGRRA